VIYVKSRAAPTGHESLRPSFHLQRKLKFSGSGLVYVPMTKRALCSAGTPLLAGCAVSLFGLTRFIVLRDLVFFGLHCLLVGYLIFRSTFLPRILGALMMFAGLGWLTFLSPALAKDLSPYNLAPGMLGEGLLIVWLLVFGVNEQRWKEQAGAAGLVTN